jgi:hypothetical protein
MKNRTLKIFTAASLLMVGNLAFAHDYAPLPGLGLATPAITTHYFRVDCSDDGGGPADHLAFSIQGTNATYTNSAGNPVAAPLISGQVTASVQTTKGPVYLAGNTVDAKNADGKGSPEIIIKAGNGPYFIAVDKNKAGPQDYSFTYHCMSLTAHTGTALTKLKIK